jgi:hypothetical protein
MICETQFDSNYANEKRWFMVGKFPMGYKDQVHPRMVYKHQVHPHMHEK